MMRLDHHWIWLGIAMLLGSGGCGEQRSAKAPEAAPAAPATQPTIVEMVARGLTFEAPDQVESGWVTFRLRNESGMAHFAIVERLPEGRTLEDQQRDIAPVFQAGMDHLNEGDGEAASAAFADLPAWFGDIVFLGGPGLVSPGVTSDATVFLEPGTYLLECYVKTDGVFHSFNPAPDAYGMVHQLTVVGGDNGAPEPAASVQLAISSEGGIAVQGTPVAGRNTVRVEFLDQTVHENFVGHDVHVAAVPEHVTTTELAAWMDWRGPEGLNTPAPVRFLGGSNEMPAGAVGYFTVDLTPGRYAWVAEVPEPNRKGMLRYFTVD